MINTFSADISNNKKVSCNFFLMITPIELQYNFNHSLAC